MAKSTNIIRGAAVTAMIALSSVGITAQANDINAQFKQNMLDALGNVFSAQVSALSTEINKDISQTIDKGLIELGFRVTEQVNHTTKNTNVSTDK